MKHKSVDLGAAQAAFDEAKKRKASASKAFNRAEDELNTATAAFNKAEDALKLAFRSVVAE